MSWVNLKNGKKVVACFQLCASSISGVAVGEYDMSLDEFCAMAVHFLGGGFAGWHRHKTPPSVNEVLSQLFELYEQTADGKWTIKAKYRID